MIKNILFVILFATSLSLCNSCPFNFLRKKESAQKSGVKKLAIASALFLPAVVDIGDSPLAHTIRAVSWLTSAAIGFTGLAQIIAEYADGETKATFNRPGYDAAINKLFIDKRFLAGAAIGGMGYLIYAFHESPQTPDAAKYAAILGLALMGEKIGEQLITDYWPYVMSQISK
ncbi:hypothetical protein BH09DEP1_BH09DEP1_7720 [soil metagenome]